MLDAILNLITCFISVMLEGSANILPYDKFIAAVEFGLEKVQAIVRLIKELTKTAGKQKLISQVQPLDAKLYSVVERYVTTVLPACRRARSL